MVPGQAQDKKKAPETKPATETKINWDGEWMLIPEDSDNVESKIDEHLKDMNFALRAWWKRKLVAACKPHRTLDILAGESFSVTLGKEVPTDTTPDGKAAEWKRSDGEKFQVSMRKDGPRITHTFQGDGATLTNVYSMRKDGKTLALQITYAAPKLENPFSYKLVFGRND
jgi:hypothetical protein